MKSQHIHQGVPAVQHKNQPFFTKNQVQKKPFFTTEKPQAKLTVGQPGDKYEQEADSVADHVVNRLAQPQADAPVIQAQCPCEDENVQRMPDLMRQGGMEEEEAVQMQGMEEEEAVQMQGMEEEEMLQTKPQYSIQRAGQVRDAFDQERELQMKSNGAPQSAGADLESQLNSAKGGGTPLPADVQTQMEGAIGANFSGVKVHTGGEAQQMNQSLNAQAFTHGRDIFFNEGKYNPSTPQGQHLLAHELTHVVQQTGEE